jgi:hypothetical protein
VPEELSALMLGNRRATYALLFRTAWSALAAELRSAGFAPAAWLVLHTWNQRLEHHPHIHALVPGGGPSLSGARWIASGPRHHHGRGRPYLTDAHALSARFRAHFLAALRRLHEHGQLRLDGDWSPLRDATAFTAWLAPLAEQPWVVFIEPPPTEESRPEHVLKYLARYLTGGPLSDRRLLAHRDGQVTFLARSKDKATGNRSQPYTLTGTEFARRWSLHILPKGLVKSRGYGGFSGRCRSAYLRHCRDLLTATEHLPPTPETPAKPPPCEPPLSRPTCPHCQGSLTCVERRERPSWRVILTIGQGPFPRGSPRDD